MWKYLILYPTTSAHNKVAQNKAMLKRLDRFVLAENVCKKWSVSKIYPVIWCVYPLEFKIKILSIRELYCNCSFKIYKYLRKHQAQYLGFWWLYFIMSIFSWKHIYKKTKNRQKLNLSLTKMSVQSRSDWWAVPPLFSFPFALKDIFIFLAVFLDLFFKLLCFPTSNIWNKDAEEKKEWTFLYLSMYRKQERARK